MVINAGGPWIDFINTAMDFKTDFIGGTKGSHIIVDHPELLEATGGSEIFFENDDGRIVLILPYLERLMIGTTDIRIENPDDAICTEDEVDYMLDMVDKVFPDITVTPDQIVFRFSGVRPLPSAPEGYTGNISRDHSIRSIRSGGVLKFPVHSLIGGKWTSFRALSEEAADHALKDLGLSRKVDTSGIPIGGGKGYPKEETAQTAWVKFLAKETGLTEERARTLFDRYGTRAEDIAQYMTASEDAPLANLPDFTRREIMYLVEHEKSFHLDDILLRRSLIGFLGYTTSDLVDELADIMGACLGWSDDEKTAEIDRLKTLMAEQHAVNL